MSNLYGDSIFESGNILEKLIESYNNDSLLFEGLVTESFDIKGFFTNILNKLKEIFEAIINKVKDIINKFKSNTVQKIYEVSIMKHQLPFTLKRPKLTIFRDCSHDIAYIYDHAKELNNIIFNKNTYDDFARFSKDQLDRTDKYIDDISNAKNHANDLFDDDKNLYEYTYCDNKNSRKSLLQEVNKDIRAVTSNIVSLENIARNSSKDISKFGTVMTSLSVNRVKLDTVNIDDGKREISQEYAKSIAKVIHNTYGALPSVCKELLNYSTGFLKPIFGEEN